MMKKQVELASGMICVVIWILLFGAGLMIPSQSYRDNLKESFTLYNFFMAGLLYTYTNVVILTCLAGLLGGICSRLTFRDYEGSDAAENNQSAKMVSVSMVYRTGASVGQHAQEFRGFSRLYRRGCHRRPGGGTEVFSTTGPDQYARVAGLLSLMGFTVGFDPTLFGTLLSSIPKPLRKTGS
jgi:hypothetical protein